VSLMQLSRGEAPSVPFFCADCQPTRSFKNMNTFLIIGAGGARRGRAADRTPRSGRITGKHEVMPGSVQSFSAAPQLSCRLTGRASEPKSSQQNLFSPWPWQLEPTVNVRVSEKLREFPQIEQLLSHVIRSGNRRLPARCRNQRSEIGIRLSSLPLNLRS